MSGSSRSEANSSSILARTRSVGDTRAGTGVGPFTSMTWRSRSRTYARPPFTPAFGRDLAPTVIGITLGVVGQAGFTGQNGRDQAWNHAGNMAGAALSGLLGWQFGYPAVFWLAAAGHRQVGQWPRHGVAIPAVAPTVRTTRIPHHGGAEDRGLGVVDGGVGDRHPQLDRAHDRVGNNRARAGIGLAQRVPSVVLVELGVGTRIVTHRGPASAHRHDTLPQRSANHRCTLDHEEPVWPRRQLVSGAG